MAALLMEPGARPANTLTPAQLSAAREALVARIDAAMDRGIRLGHDQFGLPGGLISASCYLVSCGVAAPACRGEFYTGWDMTTCRRYLDGLTPDDRAAEIESGYRMLFEGRRAICRGVLDLAVDLADAGDRLAQATEAATITADALRDRWNANAARRAAGLDREAA